MKIFPIIEQKTISHISHRAMSLIIKPTEKCNFKCTFCSSTYITDDKHLLLDIEKIKLFLQKYPNTDTIIVNGGDPMMVPIRYYHELLKYLDDNNLSTIVSLTSNLWPFKQNPNKWLPILKHPKVRCLTSFNYGNERLKHDLTPFTEKEFWALQKQFQDLVGYKLDFISVITNNNYHEAIKHVELAKEMDVNCKLNYVNVSGNAKDLLLKAKIYKLYIDVYKQGLWPWEFNTQQMMKIMSTRVSVCPISRNCDEGIRALQPSGDYYSCGSFGDDFEYQIDFDQEIFGSRIATPLQEDPQLDTMNDWCYGCSLFHLCNGCKKAIKDHKRMNQTKTHCEMMKTLEEDILTINKENRSIVPPIFKESEEF